MGRATWIDVLEATYDMDAPEDRWLEAIVRATEPLFGAAGLGSFAFTYDASVPDRMSIDGFAPAHETRLDAQWHMLAIRAAGGGRYVQETLRTVQAGTVRSSPRWAGSEAEAIFEESGVSDLVVINGLDPGGIGLLVGAASRQREKVAGARRLRYERVAAHLANGYRLRRRLASCARKKPWGADAILSPRGAVDHCETDETQDARDQLRAAAVAIDRSRGGMRSTDPDAALGGWLGLVDGRWSLVDKFDTDGKRFVLARRNVPQVEGLDLLTERERAVAGYAALGRSNKVIAYDLGIAHSTVRVLLARATRKLGVRSRAQLVDVVRAAQKLHGS